MERPGESTEIARTIWIVGAPIVFAIGVVGNIVTILVLVKNKRTSTTIFLTFLAVFDLSVVLTVLTRWWAIYTLNFDIRQYNNYCCKIHMYLTYVTTYTSNMCLVAITIERIICTLLPFQIHSICTKRLTVIVCVSLVVFFCTIKAHSLYGFILTERTSNVSQNIANSSYTHTFGEFLTTEELTRASVGNVTTYLTPTMYPSTFKPLVTQDVTIVKSCALRTDDIDYYIIFRDVIDKVSLALFVVGPNIVLFVGAIIIIRQMYVKDLIAYRRNTSMSPRLRQASQVTITMVTINFAFFFLKCPLTTLFVLRFTVLNKEISMSESFEIMWAVFQLMYNLNHSINFILYVFTGARFRRQVKHFFCRIGANQAKFSTSSQGVFSVTRTQNGENASQFDVQ